MFWEAPMAWYSRSGLYLFSILTLLVPGLAAASTCTVETSIPANQHQVGAGSATADYDGNTSVTGDQKVYAKLTNRNLLGVFYTVTIAQNTTSTNVICSYNALLPPQTSAILSGALFADPPIGWKITVSIGSESDSGVLTYTIHSLAQSPSNSGNKNAKP
jgi:hypothetical protein